MLAHLSSIVHKSTIIVFMVVMQNTEGEATMRLGVSAIYFVRVSNNQS